MGERSGVARKDNSRSLDREQESLIWLRCTESLKLVDQSISQIDHIRTVKSISHMQNREIHQSHNALDCTGI